MLSKYRLVLLLPRSVLIPEHLNPYLEVWGDKKRFDENSGVVQWPMGPNMIFQQIQWLYHHKKLAGPMLWCEPDCIPVSPTWADDLFEEYQNCGKLFMGAVVDAKNEQGQRIPKHMTGNAIYPEHAYKNAPAIMEARLTPWDVYAATQIMANCHFTRQIQHEYRHDEILSRAEMNKVVRAEAALFHTDKFGALIRFLAEQPFAQEVLPAPEAAPQPDQEGPEPPEVPLEPEAAAISVASTGTLSLDDMLERIRVMCEDIQVKRKVAYFVLEQRIVNQGFLGQHMRRENKRKREEALASAAADSAG